MRLIGAALLYSALVGFMVMGAITAGLQAAVAEIQHWLPEFGTVRRYLRLRRNGY